jgi:hypothetical protein
MADNNFVTNKTERLSVTSHQDLEKKTYSEGLVNIKFKQDFHVKTAKAECLQTNESYTL